MNKYYFDTPEFGISDSGIHLLRSRFNYETFELSQVDTIVIERGKELNNWLVILIIGVGMVSFSVFYSWRVFVGVFDERTTVIYIEHFLIPLIPLMMGSYCLYSSTKKGTVLRVKTAANKSRKFPLKELEKEGKLQALKDFLKEKLGARVTISI